MSAIILVNNSTGVMVNNSNGVIVTSNTSSCACCTPSFNGSNSSTCTICVGANGSSATLSAVITGIFSLSITNDDGVSYSMGEVDTLSATPNAYLSMPPCIWIAEMIYVGYYYFYGGTGNRAFAYVPLSNPALQPSTVGGNPTTAIRGTVTFTFDPFIRPPDLPPYTITLTADWFSVQKYGTDPWSIPGGTTAEADSVYFPRISFLLTDYCNPKTVGPWTWTPTLK